MKIRLMIIGICLAKIVVADKPAQISLEVKVIHGSHHRIGQVNFDVGTKEIWFPAVINAQENDLLEYIVVHENGKTHESLLRTEIEAIQLQLVLKLLGFRQGRGKLFHHFLAPGEQPRLESEGTAFDVLISWQGVTEPFPVNEVILDRRAQGAMKETPWIWTGSEIQNGAFQAQISGSIIALYRDSYAVLNSSHPLAVNDENWKMISRQLPALDTPVTVTLRVQ